MPRAVCVIDPFIAGGFDQREVVGLDSAQGGADTDVDSDSSPPVETVADCGRKIEVGFESVITDANVGKRCDGTEFEIRPSVKKYGEQIIVDAAVAY